MNINGDINASFGGPGQGKPDLHIIAFSVPYPAHYGGAIDVWNRIRALHQSGVKIMLHCFVYGPFKPHDAIKEVVEEVHYYPRITWPALLAPGLPYIVSSRRSPQLLTRLNTNKAPILFEGIHSTGYVDDLKGRKLFLRSHNIEHKYYSELARNSSRFQYLFFQREALALERYEWNKAAIFDHVYAISIPDAEWYREKGGNSTFVPAFHGFEKNTIKEGRGKHLLYQGDLSIEINQKSILELLKILPADMPYPIVIAGRAGESSFEDKLLRFPNIQREVDISDEKMSELIHDAQVTIIHSRNSSGMKVKIFPALYQARYIVANENSLTHTNLDKALHLYSSLEELVPLLRKLWPLEFSSSQIEERATILSEHPSDQEKANEIIRNL